MLKIIIPPIESYDEENNEFIYSKEQVLELEHSLIAISKWESKWCKPFLSSEKNSQETIDYIKCMTLNKVSDIVYGCLSNDNLEEIQKYINEPMTATTINHTNTKGGRREIITSELIYYWMIALSIPFECQKWHLNKLLTLIQVCNIKNSPPKKMSRREIMQRNKAVNEARRIKMKTGG